MSPVPASTAPFLAACAALALAGGAKLARPGDTARALRLAGLPATPALVRAGAAAEVAAAVAAVAVPGPITAAIVAASYLAFAAFVAVAVGRGWPLRSCGCFGRPDAKPSWGHALLNAGAAAAAIAFWAGEAGRRGPHLFVQEPFLLVVSAVIAFLAYLVWANPLASQ